MHILCNLIVNLIVNSENKTLFAFTVNDLYSPRLETAGLLLSVKCAFLHLLGLLCQYYPNEMQDQFERMVTLFVRKLQHEVRFLSKIDNFIHWIIVDFPVSQIIRSQNHRGMLERLELYIVQLQG